MAGACEAMSAELLPDVTHTGATLRDDVNLTVYRPGFVNRPADPTEDDGGPCPVCGDYAGESKRCHQCERCVHDECVEAHDRTCAAPSARAFRRASWRWFRGRK